MSNNPGLIVITAPSGAGKSTLAKRLLEERNDIKFSVSATTRKPRPGEVNGREYLFLSPESFEENVRKGAFLEHETFYNGIRYGTLRDQVEKILDSGYFCLLDIDVHGALNVKKKFDGRALTIFIAPPSLEVLESRLRGRGTETEEAIKVRLERARHELSFAHSFDHLVVNDILDQAYQRLLTIVTSFIAS
jgi:guanylate kinase